MSASEKNGLLCDCIVPFYNEGERIIHVLSVLAKVRNIRSIICVDGGSKDNEASQIRSEFTTVKVVCLEKGFGKSAAVQRGLQEVKTPYVMLIDADLQNLQQKELETAIAAMQMHPDIDMLILRRKNDPWISKVFRGDITVTGERVMKTADLRDVFQDKPQAYQLEFAIDYFMMRKRKRSVWMYHSGINVPKIQKFGRWDGIKREAGMYRSMFSYAGVFPSIRIMTTFARSKYNPLLVGQ